MLVLKRNIILLLLVMKNLNVNLNVRFSCINVIFLYVYIMRLYNGCLEDSLEQVVENLLQFLFVFFKNVVFDSVELVVYSFLSVVLDCKDFYCFEELFYQVFLDVIFLIKGYVVMERKKINFVDSVLFYLCRFFSRGRERLKVNFKMN